LTSSYKQSDIPIICHRYQVTSGINGVVVTGGKFANISVNFPKKLNDPNFIYRGLGEDGSWKKPEAKNS
jgi:hypothetical protein